MEERYTLEQVNKICDELNFAFMEQQYQHSDVVPDYYHLLSVETVMGETIVKACGAMVWDSVDDIRPEVDGVKIDLKTFLLSEIKGIYLGLHHFLLVEDGVVEMQKPEGFIH